MDLKVNKSQYNKFGNYNYRSCEDITEAFKPFADKYKVALLLQDDIILVGDRFYVKATATLLDCESDNKIETSALARESLEKKGMDSSQVTGATSSYARKYALNGLFALDDVKDADTEDNSPTKKVVVAPSDREAELKALKEKYANEPLRLTGMVNYINKKEGTRFTDLEELEYKYIHELYLMIKGGK